MATKKITVRAPRKKRVKEAASNKKQTTATRSANHQWMKHFDEFKEKFSTKEWVDLANQKRANLVRELYHLGEEMIDKIKSAEILANREQLIRETKEHLDTIVRKVNSSKLLDRAMATAKHTGEEILSFFNIPTSRELSSLQKRLASLEKKISNLKEKHSH